MDSDIVVREATPQDLAVRTELVRCSIVEYDLSAFFMLFFQELTLHVCVLGGAVVFIFLGGGPGAAAALLLGVAALLAGGAALAHRAAAARLAARLPAELYGCVAERRGRVLGTASVAECWGPRRSGWLQALAVAPGWRRRGVARALLAAARARAAAEGLESLEAAASQLQAAATGLLHSAGCVPLPTALCRRRPVLQSVAVRQVGDARLVPPAAAGRGADAADDSHGARAATRVMPATSTDFSSNLEIRRNHYQQ
ncbi:unnamed protein product [Spodoptera exigua]|nr:unnamed protein product [Spodoptera exigua]